MELRHLRYFVAVAEEGSLTLAAERRLHTAQPSLSRQLRNLELEIGVQLFVRSARGIQLTAAGQAFLDHARLALSQAAAAVEAARQAARPTKQSFALGFLTGQEMTWLPAVMAMLKEALPCIDVTVSSDYSPVLAEELEHGRLDLAFMRQEPDRPGLEYRVLATEPVFVFLPSDHRLAAQPSIAVEDLTGETFIRMSSTAPTFQVVLDAYFDRIGIHPRQEHEIDNLGMAMSLVASTRGFTLLPAYAKNFTPWSVICRPLSGDPPSIELVAAYRKDRQGSTLDALLARLDELKSVRGTSQSEV